MDRWIDRLGKYNAETFTRQWKDNSRQWKDNEKTIFETQWKENILSMGLRLADYSMYFFYIQTLLFYIGWIRTAKHYLNKTGLRILIQAIQIQLYYNFPSALASPSESPSACAIATQEPILHISFLGSSHIPHILYGLTSCSISNSKRRWERILSTSHRPEGWKSFILCLRAHEWNSLPTLVFLKPICYFSLSQIQQFNY